VNGGKNGGIKACRQGINKWKRERKEENEEGEDHIKIYLMKLT
jgi:hypothetical protein